MRDKITNPFEQVVGYKEIRKEIEQMRVSGELADIIARMRLE